AVAICVRNAVYLAGKRLEPGFVRMSFAGESERHHRAAMKSVFKGDDARPLRVGSRDLHCIFDGLSTAVDKQSLLWEVTRSEFIQAFGQSNVRLVGRHLNTGVKKFLGLLLDGAHDIRSAMSYVDAANTACKINVSISVDIFESSAIRFGHVHRGRMR